jgi:hypothetical protein
MFEDFFPFSTGVNDTLSCDYFREFPPVMDKFSKQLKCANDIFTRTAVCHIPKFLSSEAVGFYEMY